MPKGDIETFHEDGQWHNRIEGEGGIVSSHDSKEGAISAGRKAAEERKVEHLIKNLDGTIAEKHSYGHDPRDIPG
jgi:Uncharacterized protein conserved in bacteria (DUF2188)